jgi:hypothetical protein
MKPIQPIDLSALRQSQPATQPVRQSTDQPRRDWIIWIVVAVVLFAVVGWWRSDVGPSPTPIDNEGMYVLVVKPTDLSSLTQGQKEFVTSAKVADWVNANKGEYRAYPENQNTDSEDQIWRDLRREADGTHRVIVAKNRRLTRMTVPDGIDQGIRVLEGIR